MIPKEIEGKTPDKVLQADDGRRIEMYGKPDHDMMVKVLYELIKPKIEEVARNKNNDNKKVHQ